MRSIRSTAAGDSSATVSPPSAAKPFCRLK
jgi:hypothetical protein